MPGVNRASSEARCVVTSLLQGVTIDSWLMMTELSDIKSGTCKVTFTLLNRSTTFSQILPFRKPQTPSRSETVVWKISPRAALVWTRCCVTPTRPEVYFKGGNYLQESCRYSPSLIAHIPCLFLSVAQLVLFSFSKKRCAEVVLGQSESFYFTGYGSPCLVQFPCLTVNNERERRREVYNLKLQERWQRRGRERNGRGLDVFRVFQSNVSSFKPVLHKMPVAVRHDPPIFKIWKAFFLRKLIPSLWKHSDSHLHHWKCIIM